MYCVYIWICIMTLLNSTLKAPVSNIHFLAFLDIFFQKAPTFHDPASTDRSQILTHPTPQPNTQHQGGGTGPKTQQVEGCATGAFHEMMYIDSMLLILYSFGATLFKSSAISVFIPGGSWQWLLKDFFYTCHHCWSSNSKLSVNLDHLHKKR